MARTTKSFALTLLMVGLIACGRMDKPSTNNGAMAQNRSRDVMDAPAQVSPSGRIAPPGEPGTPLVISGKVVAPDSQAPAPGLVVYAYRTDADGYHRVGQAEASEDEPRLRGWVKTDANGQIEFTTIKPYPQVVQPPAPLGKLVDIGGYRLHLWCMGQEKGTPPVVFLPGAGDFSFTWGLVLPEVARFTRACSYDKAFEAWSDPGPLPRTMKQDAHELRLLLTRGGVQGPYVLVGASAGGPLARIFNREFPADVVGMVLVDATDADTVMGHMVNGKIVDFRVREESKGRPIPPVQTIQSNPPGPLTTEEQTRYEQNARRSITRSYSPHDRLPANLQALDVWFRSHSNPLKVKADNPFEGEEFQQLFEDQQGADPPLGEKPLIVLIADDRPRTVADQRKLADQTNPRDVEKKMQKVAQATLSKNGQYIRLASGHEIHLYQPAWVIEAVRQVVEASRIQAVR